VTAAAARDADALVRAEARRLGFDAIAVARADVPLDADFARYEAFVSAGMHGDMAWLAENASVRRRVDAPDILAGARSVVCLARRYQRDDAADPPTARAIARYARGHDYHNFLRKKVRRLAAFCRALGTPDAPVHARPLLDDAPILERAWAARAGLGFVGKNGLLIVPGQGSYVLLGEVVTTLILTPDSPIPERCGACTRCLDACPTDAFVRPFVLDARRCIAYLTIENTGAIPEPLRAGVGDHLFGCDDCQAVCPYNAARRGPSAPSFDPLDRWTQHTIPDLLAILTDHVDVWPSLSGESPLHRAGAEGLARNAAIFLGNRGRLEDTAVLERARTAHPSEVVREAAAWALGRVQATRQTGREDGTRPRRDTPGG
jgi:epoxyqueuosine reductase